MKIVNVRGLTPNDPTVVYCGREFAGWRGSPLANPYHIGKDGSREEVIAKYRRWLWQKIQVGCPLVLAALVALKEDSTLGCWCSPLPCHCDVIARAWAWSQGK